MRMRIRLCAAVQLSTTMDLTSGWILGWSCFACICACRRIFFSEVVAASSSHANLLRFASGRVRARPTVFCWSASLAKALKSQGFVGELPVEGAEDKGEHEERLRSPTSNGFSGDTVTNLATSAFRDASKRWFLQDPCDFRKSIMPYGLMVRVVQIHGSNTHRHCVLFGNRGELSFS